MCVFRTFVPIKSVPIITTMFSSATSVNKCVMRYGNIYAFVCLFVYVRLIAFIQMVGSSSCNHSLKQKTKTNKNNNNKSKKRCLEED